MPDVDFDLGGVPFATGAGPCGGGPGADGLRVSRLRCARFNIRLSPETKKRIERAASVEGRTASSFILFSALAQAERTLREHEAMVLNRREAEIFFDALVRPPKMNARLASALKEHDRRVVSV